LPLGGYVKMLDERDPGPGIAPADLPFAFNRQSVGKRFAIVVAGPVANFLLAIALFSVVFATGITEPAAIVAAPPAGSVAAQAGFDGGETVLAIRNERGSDAEAVRSWSDLRWKLLDAVFDHRRVVLRAKDGHGTFDYQVDLRNVSDQEVDDDFMSKLGFEPGGGTLTVAGVEPGSAAQRSGLQPGDTLREMNGKRVDSATAFIDFIKSHAGRAVTLEIERGGATAGAASEAAAGAATGAAGTLQALTIVPDTRRDPDTGADIGRIGAALARRIPPAPLRIFIVAFGIAGATWLAFYH